MSTPEQPGADNNGENNGEDQTTQDTPGTGSEAPQQNEGETPLEVDGGTVAGASKSKESAADDADPPGDASKDPQGPIDLDSDGDPDGPEGQGLTDAEKAKAVGGFNAPDPAIYDASGGSTKDVLGGSGLPGSVSPGHGNDQ